ncbi:MAG: SixA phosphatase family protein [Planctomycetota bacterium]
MELYLIRHAQAEEHSESGGDEARALSREGRERFRDVVRGLERLEVQFDRVYHSPYLRAQETADLLEPILAGETVVTAALARAPSEELLASLEGGSVALVGHEPWLSDLLSVLLLGWHVYEHPSRSAPFEFKKGGVARLTGKPKPGEMQLVAFWPPRTLRELGSA